MIYRLLGPLEVARGPATSDVIDLGPRKQRTVLAVLLLNRGRVVSTDRLIDALWHDDAPASAMASIQRISPTCAERYASKPVRRHR